MDNNDETILDPVKDDDKNKEDKIIKETQIENLLVGIMKQETPPIINEETLIQTRYVLGFALSSDKQNILLITKNRPAWQAGLLNGIGGKIEDYDETAYHAMEREFKEETGLHIPSHKWHMFSIMESPRFKVSVFWTESDELSKYTSVTDEVVSLESLDDLFNTKFEKCISNLSWLIGMLRDRDLSRMNSHINYIE